MVSDRRKNPQAVLFACGMNQVRSPMAAAIMQHFHGSRVFVESAGLHKGEHDPFVDAVMARRSRRRWRSWRSGRG